MKFGGKQRTFFLIVALAVILLLPSGVSAASKKASSQSGAASGTSTVKKGWVTTSKGKRYYKNGAYLTGLNKIGKKYYYFGKKGYLKYKYIKSGEWTYYTTVQGVVDGKKKGNSYYTMAGKKLTGTAKENYKTKLAARKVVWQVTNDKMSLSEKRLACFKWVSNHPYMHWRNFSKFSGWLSTYANDHFLRKKGNCVSDACAFAYLAQALGYTKVYVCLDGTTDAAHSWCEINGKVFDPMFAQTYGMSRAYNASYSVYPDPWVHQKIKLT